MVSGWEGEYLFVLKVGKVVDWVFGCEMVGVLCVCVDVFDVNG